MSLQPGSLRVVADIRAGRDRDAAAVAQPALQHAVPFCVGTSPALIIIVVSHRLVAEGFEEKPQPEVAPPDFISACKAVLLNFGNLSNDSDDRGDLSTRVRQIATEAEAVATKIYGQGMSPREQQDRMWEDETTSIFDLERMEMEAEQMGEEAPWANPDNDDIIPGFDTDGVMKIGG